MNTDASVWLILFVIDHLDRNYPVKVPNYTVGAVRTTYWNVESDRDEPPLPPGDLDAAKQEVRMEEANAGERADALAEQRRLADRRRQWLLCLAALDLIIGQQQLAP